MSITGIPHSPQTCVNGRQQLDGHGLFSVLTRAIEARRELVARFHATAFAPRTRRAMGRSHEQMDARKTSRGATDSRGVAVGGSLGIGLLSPFHPTPIASFDLGYQFGNSYGLDAFLDGTLFRLGEETYGSLGLAGVGSYRLFDHKWSPVVGIGPTLGWFRSQSSDFGSESPFAGAAAMLAMRVPVSDAFRVDITARGGVVFPFLFSAWLTVGSSWIPSEG